MSGRFQPRLAVVGLGVALVSSALLVGCDEKQPVPTPPIVANEYEEVPLEVHGFDPAMGLPGDVINVWGEGFSENPESNLAYIGGAGITIEAATESTLVCRVPIFAVSGAITVTDAAGFRNGSSEGVFEIRAPSGLVTGYNGDAGEPVITSNYADIYTIDGSLQTTATVAGTVTGAEGDGYWAILDDNDFVRSSGLLPLVGEAYDQVLPVFCGQQRLAVFFSNSAGRAFHLTDLTRENCQEAAIRIQVSWDKDDTDVDTHFLRPGGVFNQEPGDCYYANPLPDWGAAGDPSDDPYLDVDDVNGFGPENIRLDPSEDGTYSAVVYYFSDHNNGQTNAWVEIFIDGNRTAVFGPRRITNHQRWNVCTIDWPSGDVEGI